MISFSTINNKEGIREHLTSLAALNKLIDLRHEAYYNNKIRLNWFLILGRWILDECGNTSKIIGDFIPKEKIGYLDDILTREEFKDILNLYDRMTKPNVLTREEIRNSPMEKTAGRPWPTSVSSSLGSPGIPSENTKCPICLRKWDISDCHNAIERSQIQNIDLAEYEEKTIAEVNKILSQKEDAKYWISNNLSNPKHMDLNSDEKFPDLVKNRTGRFEASEDYKIETGDSAILYVWKFYHPECNWIDRAVSEQKYFTDIFSQAGFKFFLTAIPNEYCSCEKCGPWFNVDTPWGKFKIGWRKRVINIEFNGLNLSDLFNKEDVTKARNYIHAWGKEKAIEYLKKIIETVRKGE